MAALPRSTVDIDAAAIKAVPILTYRAVTIRVVEALIAAIWIGHTNTRGADLASSAICGRLAAERTPTVYADTVGPTFAVEHAGIWPTDVVFVRANIWVSRWVGRWVGRWVSCGRRTESIRRTNLT